MKNQLKEVAPLLWALHVCTCVPTYIEHLFTALRVIYLHKLSMNLHLPYKGILKHYLYLIGKSKAYINDGDPAREPMRVYVLISSPEFPNPKLLNFIFPNRHFVKQISFRTDILSNILQNIEHSTKCRTFCKMSNILQNVEHSTNCRTFYKMSN
jgi:hypothetical protein